MDLYQLVRAAETATGQPAEYRIRLMRIAGKRRPIACASDALKVVHASLQKYLLALIAQAFPQAQEYATAYFPGSSALANAKKHRGNRLFYLFDLEKAFPSVKATQLANLLAKLDPKLRFGEETPFDHQDPEGWRVKDIRYFLETYCVDRTHGLIQGLPANPHLFNLICLPIDKQCAAFGESRGWRFTRSSDDITVSSKGRIGEAERRQLRTFFEEAGFKVSHKPGKSAVLDIERGPVMITKVILDKQGALITRATLLRTLRIGLARPSRQRPERLRYLLSLLRDTHPSRMRWSPAEQRVLDLYARWSNAS